MFVESAVILPWSAQVELTAGCNLRCEYCYINAMPWERDYFKFMSPKNAYVVAKKLAELKSKMRIEFAMRGEPLMNPRVVECIEQFAKGAPNCQLQMTSNGVALLEDDGALVDSLFDAGLNILLLDCYQPYGARLVDHVTDMDVDATYHTYGTPGDKFFPWNFHGTDEYHIVFMPAIDDWKHDITRKLTNMAGNSTAGIVLEEPLENMCPIPWREPSILYDGTVPLCCNDAGVEYILGNVLGDRTMVEIWNSAAYQAARRMLRYGERWFNPCSRCDGPTPGRNKAIPHTYESDLKDWCTVQAICEASPRINGHPIEWWGPDGE